MKHLNNITHKLTQKNYSQTYNLQKKIFQDTYRKLLVRTLLCIFSAMAIIAFFNFLEVKVLKMSHYIISFNSNAISDVQSTNKNIFETFFKINLLRISLFWCFLHWKNFKETFFSSHCHCCFDTKSDKECFERILYILLLLSSV